MSRPHRGKRAASHETAGGPIRQRDVRTWNAVRLFLVVLTLLAPVMADAAKLDCARATTLEALVDCVRGHMPGSGSNGFVPPTAAEQAGWRSAVRRMLQGGCDFVLPDALAGVAELRSFEDAENGRAYCLLIESLDANGDGRVDRGFGTFIVDDGALRELSHQAPHPIADSMTDSQAVAVFKGTRSRSFLMAGAHRRANEGSSTCQSSYGPADPAHNVDNMFHATNAELAAHYGGNEWAAIQWHGMAADTCPEVEVHLSQGRALEPGTADPITILKKNLLRLHPAWKVATPGSGSCRLNATLNTQGRLINGVAPADVCGTRASRTSAHFVHIEQDPGFRDPADWIAVVSETWPAPAAESLGAMRTDT